mmetsp:Transcript_6368/g.14937  ORF Transcript_6368/g.14937 Transcript_6368/m.14937 type:complete len:116 (-) Transcript_6368:74-421(-)
MTEFNIKFLFADGTNMEELFDAGTTVADAKMKLISKWPEGQIPVTGPDDLRMIHQGKVLENTNTFEVYRVQLGNQVIMHLQPRPPQPKQEEKTASGGGGGATSGGTPQNRCCTIL